MKLAQLEKIQIGIYVAVLGLGAGFGLWWPALGGRLEFLISPALAVLLYGMFA
ncbi:MAG: hypothetical protein ABR605_10090 [Desulfurivibrionaceae bacterium]